MRTAKVISLLLIASAIAAAPADFKVGTAVEVREGDLWSSATIEKKEGRKYQIKYNDGNEEWVTSDRLRAAGGGGASDASGSSGSDATEAQPGGSGAKAAKGSGGNSSSITVEGPFTEISLQPVKGVPKRANGAFNIKPATRPSAPFTGFTPAAGTDLGRVDQLLMCPDTPGMIVAVGSRHDDDTPLLIIDVNNPSKMEPRLFSVHDHRVIGAVDGGRVLLTQPTEWGSLTLHLWEFRDGKYQLKANYTFTSSGERNGRGQENKHPDWARLLSPTRLLFRSGSGETYLIDLTNKHQTAYIQCGDLTMHPSGQFIVSSKDGAGILLRTSDLSIVAAVPNAERSFTVDATGTYSATSDGRSLTVLKVASGQEVTKAGAFSGRGRFELIGPNEVLVEGKTYYDLKTGIPVWNYNVPNGSSLMLANGQMLFVSPSIIAMGSLPDANGAKALISASPDSFVISPGAHIAIAGNLGAIGDAAKARTNIEHAITAAGHKVDDAAPDYKLTFTTAAGPTGKFSIREFQLMNAPVTREVDAPSTIVTVVLTKGDAEIWKTEVKFSAEVMLQRQRDESLEAACARAARPDPNRLNGLDIPSYIVKGASQGSQTTLGESVLTREGFKPSKAAAE